MKRIISICFLILNAICAFSQDWFADSFYDDFTMEEIHSVKHYNYEGDIGIDAIYYLVNGYLKIIKEYDRLAFFNEATDAEVYNNGKISDYVGKVTYRFIYKDASDYEEFEKENVIIRFLGYGQDNKITTDGFYGSFFLKCDYLKLQKANYLTLKYYDKIAKKMVTKRINLSGFTKAYNSFK